MLEQKHAAIVLSCRRSRGYHRPASRRRNRPEERIHVRVNISVYVYLHVTSIIALKKSQNKSTHGFVFVAEEGRPAVY
jgi:hypothetical protein